MSEHTPVNGLTPAQHKKIMIRIREKHWLVSGRNVKYIDTSFDFRTDTFWRILVRPYGKDKLFTTTNRFDNPKHDNLYDEIIEWLKEAEPKKVKNK